MIIRSCITLFIVLSSISLSAEYLMREGYSYFSVGQYERSFETYSQALEIYQEPWQRGVILYNMGTVLLVQNQWNNALEMFNKADRTSNLPPYLKPRLKINTALALLGQIEAILTTSKDPLAISPSRLSNPIILLDAASRAIESAKNEYCSYYQIKTLDDCEESTLIRNLTLILKDQVSRVGAIEMEYRLATIPFKEGAELLEIRFATTLRQIKLWKEENGIDATSPSVLANAFRSPTALWKALKARVEELPPEYQPLFRASRKKFRLALIDLDNNLIDKGIAGLEESYQSLTELIAKLPDPHPLKAQLEKSITRMTALLVFGKVTESAIKTQRQKMDDLIILSKENDQIEKEVEKSISRLKIALEETRKRDLQGARLFLLASAQSLQQALLTYNLLNETEPKEYLRSTIELQQDALDLAIEAQETGISRDNTVQLLRESQTNALTASELFIEKVYQWQKTHYYGIESPQSCQKNPWNYAMPLFHEGYKKSKDALYHLSSNPPSLNEGINLQRKALKFWHSTLYALEEEPPPETDVKKDDVIPEPEDEKEEEEKGPSNQPLTVNQILQTLIEIEQQDKMPSENTEGQFEGIDKPW